MHSVNVFSTVLMVSAPSVTPGHRERKKLATWRSIRTSALELFAGSSFDAVSVEEIAAAAGLSKTTFFNYFATKEAVILDPDPETPDRWRTRMADRPVGEPLWDAVQEVVFGYLETYSDRIALHCRLKLESPQLAESARDVGEQFWGELRSWALDRTGAAAGSSDELQVTLLLNAARSAVLTAYDLWTVDEPFERFLDLSHECFATLGAGFIAGPLVASA